MTEASASPGVSVHAEGGDYRVLVDAGLLGRLPKLLREHAPAYRYAFVSDDNVAPLHAERLVADCRSEGLNADLFDFPAGEASKTREQWSILTDAMIDAGLGRDGCVVALGGGVTTDLAGFVAATFMRGLPVVQLPTSYLAMIDASVGGKTGVDVRAGKNLVGSFHPPAVVVADPEVLETLPEAERAQGLVEAFKHGAVLDVEYLESLQEDAEALLQAAPSAASAAVLRSVQLKAEVVSEDEREGGYRQVLNFGHTIGHALEAAAGFAIGHGTSIAAGMLLEAELGERLGVTEAGTGERLRAGLETLKLPQLPQLDPELVVGYLATDKKVRSGRPRYVLLRRIGEVDPGYGWSHEAPEALVRDVLQDMDGTT